MPEQYGGNDRDPSKCIQKCLITAAVVETISLIFLSVHSTGKCIIHLTLHAISYE